MHTEWPIHFPSKIEEKSAFTLVELLVVLSIILLLSATAMSQYLQAIERSDAAACQVNLHVISSALISYRLDYNRFPPADGLADTQSHPDRTGWGCGPSANGYWSGVSLLLVEGNYCSCKNLFCPALKRAYSAKIPAYSTCSPSTLADRDVPQWNFLRYAYNNAAEDAGGTAGGEHDIEQDWRTQVWMVRCLHLDSGQFDPERHIRFPHYIREPSNEPPIEGSGEFELNVLGSIRNRIVIEKP